MTTSGLQDALVDEATGHTVPDVLRLEAHPLEIHDGAWHATIIIHRRGPDGQFMYDDKVDPLVDREMVRLVVGSVWSV